jgi:hypothetical protein
MSREDGSPFKKARPRRETMREVAWRPRKATVVKGPATKCQLGFCRRNAVPGTKLCKAHTCKKVDGDWHEP